MFSRLNLSNLPFPCITDDSERVDKQAKLTQIGWHKTPIDLDFLTKVSIVLFIKVALEDFPQCPQQYTFIIHGWRHSPKAPISRVAPVQVSSSTIPPTAWAAWGRWCGRHWAERGDCLLSSRNWDFPPPPLPPPAAWLLSSGAGHHTTSTLTREKVDQRFCRKSCYT